MSVTRPEPNYYFSPATSENGTSEMNLHEHLVRTQMSERLGEATNLRRGHQLALARRKSRRAERAALQARLVLARSL